MTERTVDADPQTVTVRVPISIRRHGGRKLVLAPDGTSDIWLVPARRVDNAMVKAIARAFRWRDMLENGTHATVEEIAVAEKIHSSYVSRILRLTLLAPEFVEANSRRTAAGANDAGRADATVSDALVCAEIGTSVLRLNRHRRGCSPPRRCAAASKCNLFA